MLDLDVPKVSTDKSSLNEIDLLDKELEHHFKEQLLVQLSLTRSLVSFQANKSRPVYRWYKFKEAFSAALVENLFQEYGVTKGRILDPFAGSGTALFAASELGIDSDGIELLPIGQQIISTKKLLEAEFTAKDFETLQSWGKSLILDRPQKPVPLIELRITKELLSNVVEIPSSILFC